MKRYLIYSYEQMFQGLHGINTIEVLEGNYNEVSEIAMENSFELMETYHEIYNALDEEVQCAVADGMDEDEAWVEAQFENMAFQIWKIDESKAKGISTSELNKMAWNYIDGFIKDYCIEV
jgi:hypothetical protein